MIFADQQPFSRISPGRSRAELRGRSRLGSGARRQVAPRERGSGLPPSPGPAAAPASCRRWPVGDRDRGAAPAAAAPGAQGAAPTAARSRSPAVLARAGKGHPTASSPKAGVVRFSPGLSQDAAPGLSGPPGAHQLKGRPGVPSGEDLWAESPAPGRHGSN